MSGLSSYAVRMARLSAQIFGEVVNPVDSRSLKVVQLFQELPLAKRKEVYEWYPQHKIYYAMTQRLRFMGLFRCVSLYVFVPHPVSIPLLPPHPHPEWDELAFELTVGFCLLTQRRTRGLQGGDAPPEEAEREGQTKEGRGEKSHQEEMSCSSSFLVTESGLSIEVMHWPCHCPALFTPWPRPEQLMCVEPVCGLWNMWFCRHEICKSVCFLFIVWPMLWQDFTTKITISN